MTGGEIGVRVREAMQRIAPVPTQAMVAEQAEMTADAMSRALKGERGFASIELARIADFLRTDIHWLITGEPDPLAVKFVARHTYDPQSREYDVAGRAQDEEILDSVHLAYRQAQPWLDQPKVDLPDTPEGIRDLLGNDFVRTFSDWVEQRLGVDVVRIPGLSTDYSFIINGRPVILLAARSAWFRSNFSLAHELAHLALKHPECVEAADGEHEPVANAFAARLLLPEAMVRQIPWTEQTDEQVAAFLWHAGVSTESLKYRLTTLGLAIPDSLADSPPRKTLSLLRRNQASIPHETLPGTAFIKIDPISSRIQQAAERRVPEALASALVRGMTEGSLNAGTLSWLLGLPMEEDSLEEPEPEPSTDDLMEELGIRPLS